jgi:hypothetical protein
MYSTMRNLLPTVTGLCLDIVMEDVVTRLFDQVDNASIMIRFISDITLTLMLLVSHIEKFVFLGLDMLLTLASHILILKFSLLIRRRIVSCPRLRRLPFP